VADHEAHGSASTVRHGGTGMRTGTRLAARGSTALAFAGAAAVWVALLAPLVILIVRQSPHGTWSTLSAPGALDPLYVSLVASGTALGAMVLLGTPLAYLLARDRLPFPRLVEIGIVAPLMMPPLVVGLLLVFLIGPQGTVGNWLADIHLTGTNTFFALVVAEFYEAAPYYVLGAHAAIAAVDPRLEQDATLLGDRPLQALRRVTLPLAAPGVAMALSTAWARAIGAFGAVVIVAYYPRALPLQIFVGLQEFGLPGALPLALLLVVVALPLPVLAYLWSARARGRTDLGEAA
jgi:molybdate/tungstate transport system permease protein